MFTDPKKKSFILFAKFQQQNYLTDTFVTIYVISTNVICIDRFINITSDYKLSKLVMFY